MPTHSPYAPEELWKTHDDNRLFSMHYEDCPELAGGETLSSATVSISPTGPTLGSAAIVNGTIAQFRISGGTAPAADAETRYVVTVLATTSGGNVIEGRGILWLVN